MSRAQTALTAERQWMEDAPTNVAYLLPVVLELAEPIRPGSRVLDVGCGNGFIAGQFLDRGARVVGIDLNSTGVEIARRRYPRGRFEVAAADEHVADTLGEGDFDIVLSTEVIEHVYDPRAFVRGCRAALRPGGRFICSTPYHGYLKNVLVALTDTFDAHVDPLWDDGHIKFWSRRTLTALLLESGFASVRFRGAGRAPYLWKSMVLSAERPLDA